MYCTQLLLLYTAYEQLAWSNESQHIRMVDEDNSLELRLDDSSCQGIWVSVCSCLFESRCGDMDSRPGNTAEPEAEVAREA